MIKKRKLLLTLYIAGAIIVISCNNSKNIELEKQYDTTTPLKENESEITDTAPPKKLKIFNDISSIRTALNNNDIGSLRPWHNDGLGWISSTDYYSFGTADLNNNLMNNLAYYLESKSDAYVETVKLVLNINNSIEKTEALSLLNNTSNKTLSSLAISIPKGLSKAIKSGKEFNYDNNDYIVSLTLNKSNIETWKLTIEAK